VGRIGITDGGARPPLSEDALRKALVDNAALVALIRRGFDVEVRTGGRIVGKRIAKKG
jgi:hypothetical protein